MLAPLIGIQELFGQNDQRRIARGHGKTLPQQGDFFVLLPLASVVRRVASAKDYVLGRVRRSLLSIRRRTPPAVLAYPVGANGSPPWLQFDAQDAALLWAVVPRCDHQFEPGVEVHVCMGPGAPTSVSLPSAESCALSADGKQVIVSYAVPSLRSFTLAELHPAG